MYLFVKRAFDVAASALGLVGASPLIAILAIAVKMSSPGPVFYRGKRVGRYGRPFHILKFRTMVENAERLGGTATANDDIRLTSLGKRIRRWKLDELPQLWNVLTGEMSLVGPRPEVETYVAAYGEAESRILELRPGLTDWATIWNSDEGAALAGSVDAEKVYRDVIRPIKTELQLLYCDTGSFRTDVKILGYTFVKLVNSEWVPAEIAQYGTSLSMGASCDRVKRAALVPKEDEPATR